MKCAIHTERDAVEACSNCGRFVCPECKVSIAGSAYCNACLQSRLKTGAWPGQPRSASCNPGMGANTPVPEEIRGWNWGGFLLTWIWGIGNNVWISLIAQLSFIPWIGLVIELVMRIILGVRGNEWAWQRKKWDSIEHFKKTQRTWMWWGVSALIAQVIFFVALAVLAVSVYKILTILGINQNLLGNVMPWLY